ncbi:uncharacterized protein [Antedon mediterranea]|uniref:uncharacterized protein n=1 Tax=Antedon mediterranea TaxID=105859 RepID=UPI003AF66152
MLPKGKLPKRDKGHDNIVPEYRCLKVPVSIDHTVNTSILVVTNSSIPSVSDHTKMKEMPRQHFAWALASLFCFLPFGVAAVINSRKVRPLFQEGKYQLSSAASRRAKVYSVLSTVIGLLVATIIASLLLIDCRFYEDNTTIVELHNT